MRNLKEEMLSLIDYYNKSIEDIDYCYIHSASWLDEDVKVHCKGNFDLEYLDFEYNNGFGGREVGGFIVFKDKAWLERNEYDGSEWWEYLETPTLENIKGEN